MNQEEHDRLSTIAAIALQGSPISLDTLRRIKGHVQTHGCNLMEYACGNHAPIIAGNRLQRRAAKAKGGE